MSSTVSYLTRRQRAHASPTSHNSPHCLEPFSAALVPNHERGSLQTSPAGGAGVGRSRRRGSPFAALSEAYKPPRAAIFSRRVGGRNGGEVLGLRSSNFAWPKSTEALPADPRHLQRQQQGKGSATGAAASSEAEVAAPGSKEAVLPLVRLEADEITEDSRWASSSAAEAASAASAPSLVAAAAAATESAATPTTPSATATTATSPVPAPEPHRRTVSWGKAAVYTYYICATQTQSDVYSPDLHAVEIAKRLAVLVRDPELRRAAQAVEMCRRHSASIVRSFTSRQDGGVDGFEEACRLYVWRESAFLRETDELVRCIVVGPGEEKVWRLKASYRAARRKMECGGWTD